MKRQPFVPVAYYVGKRPSRHLLGVDYQRLAELALASASKRLVRRVGAWRGNRSGAANPMNSPQAQTTKGKKP